MSDFTGKKIANTYKNLLQVDAGNTDLTTSLLSVQTGAGNNTPLQLSTDKINLGGTLQIDGTTLTAGAATLNAVADLTGTTGIVAVSAGTVHGRTIAVGSPLSITNANGTEGNPTINLATTGITSATYGPLGKFNIDTYGRVISVSVATTISANAFVGGTLSGSALTVENNTSIGGDVVIAGTTNMKAVSATDVTFNNLTVGTKITTNTVTATTVETSILRATTASITNLTAGTLSFSDTSVSSLNATNLFAVSANATNLFKDGESVATSAEVATLSATMATSIANRTSAITSINSVVTDLSATMATSINNRTTAITSINTVVTNLSSTLATSIANVSALSKTNLDAITSINTVVGDLSSTMATSINNRTQAITSINTVVTNLSATMATSIANVSALSKTNLDAITSINTVIGNLSVNAITSINTKITNLSATMATSIANVSALTKTNLDAVTSINTVVGNLSSTMATSINNRTTAITSINTVVTNLSSTLATSIANVSALSKTNLDAITSINTVVGDLSSTLATSIGNRTSAITSINTVISNLSSTMATSVNNRTSAITSINTVITNLSATLATSIANNTATTSVSAFTVNALTVVSGASFGDNDRANFGAGNDLAIFHDGTNNIFRGFANPMYIQTDDTIFLTKNNNAETMAKFIGDGAVELYHNNTKSLETRSLGFKYEDSNVIVDIGNQSNYGSIEVGGSAGGFIDFKAPKSDDYDFRLITFGSTGVIHSDDFHIQSKTAENYLDATINGSVNLYYDNVKKFETTSDGAKVTGDLQILSTDADANADPTLDLYRNSASPADNDLIGEINFSGENDAGEKITYATIDCQIADVSDGTEDHRLQIKGLAAGGLVTYYQAKFGSNHFYRQIRLESGVNIQFEGSTSDSHQTILDVTDPTADRTITFPDATGTVALTSDVATVSATMATSISNRTSAITSINSVITNLSSTVATSINNRTAAITSINTVITNLSATMATSIANAGGVDPIPFAIALG